jgi:hypothetical protein
MFEFFRSLDRRWIFLAMLLAVAIPILLQLNVPEKPSDLVRRVFNAIEDLPNGSNVLLAFDYDPASEGELGPMATAMVRHCCEKDHKLYFLALWPVGTRMIEDKIAEIVRPDYPQYVEDTDFVNLGFKAGNEGVINVIVTDIKKLFTTNHKGTPIEQVPMMKSIKSVQDMKLILNVSAGYPGTKEWVQYAADPYDITLAGGCTGVQAPLLYPYIPRQLTGLLGAIKGAAEYEACVAERYPRYADRSFNEGLRRMGPQLVAHLLMVGLIILGNIIYFMERSREKRA